MLSTHAQTEIQIDASKSVIKWSGANLFKYNKHFGTVQFKSGEIAFKNDSIVGGQFIIGMNTIINTDGKYNEMLVDHLKGEDFFDTKNYPNAKLEITKVTYIDSVQLDINANLTIKNRTQKIKYKTVFESYEDKLIMKSKFIIDRTRWNINFKSQSLFSTLKNRAISDAIEFDVIVSN